MVASGVPEPIAHQFADGLREEILLSHGYQLVHNTKDVMKELSSYGSSHVIASSHIPELSEIINQLGISSYFDTVYNSGMISYEKPNPDFFVATFNDLPREQIAFMVGDSIERDIKGAIEVGINGIWFNRLYDDQKTNEKVSAIRELSELPKIVGEKINTKRITG